MSWQQLELGVLQEFADCQEKWGDRIQLLASGQLSRRREIVLAAQARWRAKNRLKMRRDWHERYSPKARVA